MTEQHMPSKIWATYDGGEWSTARLSNDRLFIRADIAERMAESLEECLGLLRALGAGSGYAADTARSALSAFRTSTQDTEARHD